jgi:hypothetical protein
MGRDLSLPIKQLENALQVITDYRWKYAEEEATAVCSKLSFKKKRVKKASL